MEREVAGRTLDPEVGRLVRPAVGAMHDVVNLEPARGAATWRLATAAVAAPHDARPSTATRASRRPVLSGPQRGATRLSRR
jgi:hypothetical protein